MPYTSVIKIAQLNRMNLIIKIWHSIGKWYFSWRTRLALPEYIILSAVLFVLTSFILFYLIDLRNLWGIRDWLFDLERVYFYFTYTPFFFQHYGRNSGFAEIAQWGLLATAISIAFWLAGAAKHSRPQLARLGFLLGIGFVLMLVEDAGNLRHTLMSYVQLAAGEPDQGTLGTIFEAVYFAILGGIPLYALVRHGRALRTYGKAFGYMIMGFVLYAIAAGLSFAGTAFQMLLDRDLYTILGDALVKLSFRLGDADLPNLWEHWNQGNWLFQVGFFLMDSLIEENLELLAGAFLVAALLTVKYSVDKENKV